MARILPPVYPYVPIAPNGDGLTFLRRGDLIIGATVPSLSFGGLIFYEFDDPSLWETRLEVVTLPHDIYTSIDVSYFSYHCYISEDGLYDIGQTRRYTDINGNPIGIGGAISYGYYWFYRKVATFDYVQVTQTNTDALRYSAGPPRGVDFFDACAVTAGCPQNQGVHNKFGHENNSTWAVWRSIGGGHAVYSGRAGSWGYMNDSADNPPYVVMGDGVGVPSTEPLQSNPNIYVTDFYDNVTVGYDPIEGEFIYYTGPNYFLRPYWFGDIYWLRGMPARGRWKIGSI